MLKRIRVEELALGMFLHELCGSWMEHPFWRNQFLLQDADDLVRIRNTNIQEAWIDTSRGLDVAVHTQPAPSERTDAAIDTSGSPLKNSAALEAPPATRQPPRLHQATSMGDELVTAARICQRSKIAVVSMFNEARMGRALDMSDLQEVVEEISASIARHPDALISLARLKTADEYTYMHSVAVCALMMALGRQLQLNDTDLRSAGMAGLLHDLGKARVPLAMLNKPGKLTDDEFTVVRSHPVEGHRMLLQGGVQDAAVLDACLHHHERIDGKGYPGRLDGDTISQMARMTAICDVYDAITSDRPYKRGWDPSEALRRMAGWSDTHLDARLFQAFVKSLGIYPVGSLVRLRSQHIAVVVEQTPRALLQPRVNTFFCTERDQRIAPNVVDLAHSDCTDKIEAREDPEYWQFSDINTLCMGRVAALAN